MGSVGLRARIGARQYDIQCSLCQALVLLCFNNAAADGRVSFAQLAQETGIPTTDLHPIILSLTSPHHRLLVMEPETAGDLSASSVRVNDAFRSKSVRVKIDLGHVPGATEAERTSFCGRLEEDRKYQTEAAIVRIMKARKTMPHAELIAEVVRQLSSRFIPNIALVKQQIESLIEREYLERSKRDRCASARRRSDCSSAADRPIVTAARRGARQAALQLRCLAGRIAALLLLLLLRLRRRGLFGRWAGSPVPATGDRVALAQLVVQRRHPWRVTCPAGAAAMHGARREQQRRQ